MISVQAGRAGALACTAGLIVLGLAWELWLAPTGRGLLALKVLPLAAALPGLARHRLYTYRWLSLLVWLYVLEGLLRATTERSAAQALAAAEVLIACTLFAVATLYIRRRLRPNCIEAAIHPAPGAEPYVEDTDMNDIARRVRLTAFAAAACAALLTPLLTPPTAHAQVIHRCEVDGRTVYQQGSCGKQVPSREVPIHHDKHRPRFPDRRDSILADKPPPDAPRPPTLVTAAPLPQGNRSEIEFDADRCLDWYRPRLRDPRGAYWSDARREQRVLTISVHATNGFGGFDSKTAACEIFGGRLDEGWTRIHAERGRW